jgi:methionyl-tRNA formyltransferase
MKLFVLANGPLGRELLSWLVTAGEEVVGLAVHPPARARLREEIVAAAGLPPQRVFDGARLGEPEVLESIRSLGPALGISIMFGYILRPPFLGLFPRGVVNLHPAYLPWNRGAYPNVWSLVEGTPAGATLHYIDPGVDTGDLIAQVKLAPSPADTGATLYRRQEEAAATLFRQTWPGLRAGTAPRTPQDSGGSSHRMADVARIDEVDLDRRYTGRELIDLLRARTFPPHKGAYFRVDGRRYYLRLQIEEDDE